MEDLPTLRQGRHYFRGEDDYEQARSQTVWNARAPQRYPEVVVQAVDVDDVVAAVRYAQQRDLRIGVRSGGHSWAGNHVRGGGVLLDVCRLDQCTIDADARVAARPLPDPRDLLVHCAKEMNHPAGFLPELHAGFG